MFKKYHVILVLLILSLTFTFVGCNKNKDDDKTPTLSATELELTVGETKTLTVNDYDGAIEWGTDNFDVISITDAGEVTALAVGEATVVAYLDGGEELSCKIICKISYVSVPKLVLDGEIAVDNEYSIALRLDGKHESYELSPVLKLDGQPLSDVSFTLSSEDSAKVAVDGTNVIAKAETNGVEVNVWCEYQGKTYTTTVNVVVKGV